MFKNKYTVIILIMTIVISLSIFYSVNSNSKDQDSLLICTAVSLSEPMTEVKRLFENKYEIKILLNLNGSQSLASQISRGANPDIFIAAGNTPYDFLLSKQIDINKLDSSNLKRYRKYFQMIFQDPYSSLILAVLK